MILVKVAQLGQQSIEVGLNSGATVADAIRAAGLSSEGKDIRRDGSDVALTATVDEGDVLSLVPKVKGGI